MCHHGVLPMDGQYPGIWPYWGPTGSTPIWPPVGSPGGSPGPPPPCIQVWGWPGGLQEHPQEVLLGHQPCDPGYRHMHLVTDICQQMSELQTPGDLPGPPGAPPEHLLAPRDDPGKGARACPPAPVYRGAGARRSRGGYYPQKGVIWGIWPLAMSPYYLGMGRRGCTLRTGPVQSWTFPFWQARRRPSAPSPSEGSVGGQSRGIRE